MAVTQIAFVGIGNDVPVAYYTSATFEIKTPSGTSAATTIAATDSQNICRIATDTAIYVTFATSPTATSANGFLVPANAVEHFRVTTGQKAAVITA